jgi:CHASE2 domain-containing sensor protein/signal transduction histidine kinase
VSDPLLRHHLRRFHLEHLASTLGLAVLCVALSLSGALSSLDRRLYDLMQSWVPSDPDPSLVIVAIDEYSLRQLGRWPWDRAVHAGLINQLRELGAQAVVYDLLLTDPDPLRPESDQLLADAIARHGRVYLPVHIGPLRGGSAPVEGLPWRQFAEAAHRLGHVDLQQDRDGLVRGLWMRSGVGQAFWPHISLAVLQDRHPQAASLYERRQRGQAGRLVTIQEHPRRIPFTDVEYPRVSAADVLDGRVGAPLLAGRVVLVGATAEELGDIHDVPGPSPRQFSGVEINARILDALLQDTLIVDVAPWSAVLLSLLVALLAPLWLPFLGPRWSVPLAAGLMVLALLLCAGMLVLRQLWWSPAPAMATVMLAVPLWTWRRLRYSLDYLTRMITRVVLASEQGGRLVQPAEMTPLLRMLKVMPLRAWRLENRQAAELQAGGESVEDAAWQGQAARHYPFQRGRQSLELSVLWRSPRLAEQVDSAVKAMLARVSSPSPVTSSALRPVVQFVDSMGVIDRRQRGLTRAFHAALSQVEEGVVLADACGEVLLANPRLMSMLSLEERPVSGWHLLDLARDLRLEPDAWAALIRTAVLEGRAVQALAGRQGETWSLSLSRVEAGGQAGQILMLALHDVSEQTVVQRTRAELLHFLSHDLRSPMISILALTEKMRQTPGASQDPEFLDQLEMHARRNLGVAEQFLQLIRVELLPQIELTELDMLPVVESAMEQVAEQARAADVLLRFDYQPDDAVWVRGNHELLERLLINLLRNAIRHSYAGGSVDVRLCSAESEVQCEVRDRGPGIPLELQSSLFDCLQGNGAGLGLRYVGIVARRHGGRMLLDSKPGEGSRFTLALPILVLDEL